MLLEAIDWSSPCKGMSEVLVMISSRQAPVQLGLPCLSSKRATSIKRPDALGIAGVVMLFCGAWFVLSGRYPPPLWITWMIGPLLWYLGVATTIIWLLWRVFGTREQQ